MSATPSETAQGLSDSGSGVETCWCGQPAVTENGCKGGELCSTHANAQVSALMDEGMSCTSAIMDTYGFDDAA